jgi:hypothetical protein
VIQLPAATERLARMTEPVALIDLGSSSRPTTARRRQARG